MSHDQPSAPVQAASARTKRRTSPSRDLLTVPEAASYLNVSERFVRRLVEERRLRFYRVGDRHLRFDTVDLDRFVDVGCVEPTESRR